MYLILVVCIHTDYLTTTSDLVIPAGTTVSCFVVPILEDTALEGDEVFLIQILGVRDPAEGMVVISESNSIATVTIIDSGE